ncbi:MAG: hypothetical protein IKJ99_03395 [Oscillospiraceae bacterium]|nr:hypothetical protein [Oscillospiraceae bacterium]
MFVKVVRDGVIIDAVKDLCCCKYVKRSGMVLRCNAKDTPSGIISERTGEIYQVEGWALFPKDVTTAGVVTIEKIDEIEYDALVKALEVTGPVAEPEEDPEIPANATIEFVKEAIIKRMSAACNTAITNGVDVVLSDGVKYHFSLKLEDQLNLMSLQSLILSGAEVVPYHADGEECSYFSAEDFQRVATAATQWKIYQESYFNNLRLYIQSLTTIPEIMEVEYGMPIPDEYVTDVFRTIMQQMGVEH